MRIRASSILLCVMLMTAGAPALAMTNDQAIKDTAAALAAIKARAVQLKTDPAARGCLGKDAVTCLASLSTSLYLSGDTTWLGDGIKLPHSVERDIYGKPMLQSVEFQVSFTPNVRPNKDSLLKARLWLADGEHVSGIDFDLDGTPLLAHTTTQWDATHVYELTVAVLGQQCVTTDKLLFYRAYDKVQRQSFSNDDMGNYANPDVASRTSGSTAICGATMRATMVSGMSADVGSYGGAMLGFEVNE